MNLSLQGNSMLLEKKKKQTTEVTEVSTEPVPIDTQILTALWLNIPLYKMSKQ